MKDIMRPLNYAVKLVIDIICICLVGFPILIYYLAGKPSQRGFFCDDTSIRYPFKESTVPNTALYISCLGIPIVAIIITEFLRYSNNKSGYQYVVLYNKKINPLIVQCAKYIGFFGFGAATSQLITDVAKYQIGRLRPHFMDVCKPNVNCNEPYNALRYIEEYICMGNDQTLNKAARLSFPSGHSSFSFYCMVFLACYFQYRFTWREAKLLRPIFQVLAVLLAWYIALTRVSDNKHHWSDVLCGSLLGIVVAIVNAKFVTFQSKEEREEKINHLVKEYQAAEESPQDNEMNATVPPAQAIEAKHV